MVSSGFLGDYIEGMFEEGIMSNERYHDVLIGGCDLGGTSLAYGIGGSISSHAFEVGVAIERSLHGLWGISGIREVTEVVDHFG